ncbi:MAG: efflux RND transporter periplasmic adaptor subunit [Verrucomicrobiota bacterium]|nr:efflux RND transporter periplasmic adaptor subunit [Verrucomicrobiota bacterium]
MLKNMIIMLVAVGAIIAGLVYFKVGQIKTAMAMGALMAPPPPAVSTMVAKEDAWPTTLYAVGTVDAVQGVKVSAELDGVVTEISFESGAVVKKGTLLAKQDTSTEETQLASALASAELAKIDLERMKGLRASETVSQSTLDAAIATARQSIAEVARNRTYIEKKSIRAPFDGRLGIRAINLGQQLRSGDMVVALETFDPVYVNFSLPQQSIGELKAGQIVKVSLDAYGTRQFEGTITAINPRVDTANRNVQVQATFINTDGALLPGMFCRVNVLVGEVKNYITIPSTAISYNPYGDAVYVLVDLKDDKGVVQKGKDGKPVRGVHQQFVVTGPSRGDQVAILSGINPGDEIVTSGVMKLQNNMPVNINNEPLAPSNSATPNPVES